MQKLTVFYRYINLLSIDVAVGAVVCALFFSDIFRVHLRIYGLIALGLTVWIIYTADHLRDARVIGGNAISERRQFHRRYAKPLIVVLIGALILDAVVVTFMRKPIFEFGIYLAAIVLVYLTLHHVLRFLKELTVAVLYTCGVVLPSGAVSEVPISPAELIPIIQLFLVAWINLLVFSSFDYRHDVQERQHSFTTQFGQLTTRRAVYVISVVNCSVWLLGIWLGGSLIASGLFVLMNGILLLLFMNKDEGKGFSRWWGDAVFFIPGIYWLWHHL